MVSDNRRPLNHIVAKYRTYPSITSYPGLTSKDNGYERTHGVTRQNETDGRPESNLRYLQRMLARLQTAGQGERRRWVRG